MLSNTENNRVLFVEINNNGFLCCPGGHVELGEDSISEVKRETEEEIGVKCENVKLIALIENFFKNKKANNFTKWVCITYLKMWKCLMKNLLIMSALKLITVKKFH